jgi:hypothetical protein
MWGVCHELWPQFACRRPVGPYEAFGIARDVFEDIAARKGDWGRLP